MCYIFSQPDCYFLSLVNMQGHLHCKQGIAYKKHHFTTSCGIPYSKFLLQEKHSRILYFFCYETVHNRIYDFLSVYEHYTIQTRVKCYINICRRIIEHITPMYEMCTNVQVEITKLWVHTIYTIISKPLLPK